MASSMSRPAMARVLQSFTATASKHPVRKLHMTGAQANSQYLQFESAVAQLPRQKGGPAPPRHFNTSRDLKAVNDSSTMDFTYMPDLYTARPSLSDSSSVLRIPILPDNDAPAPTPLSPTSPTLAAAEEAADSAAVIRPVISIVSHDESNTIVSPMSEVTDNNGMEAKIDFEAVTETVGRAVQGAMATAEEVQVKSVGIVREVFEGLMDDLLGKKVGGVGKAA